MGVGLLREVVSFLSMETKMTPAERAVLMFLAERGNDDSREAWCSPDWDLATLTGLSAVGLRRCLERLAGRGVEVRVILGVRSDGVPLVACRGRQTTYRLPALTAVPPTRDDTQVSPLARKDDTQVSAIRAATGQRRYSGIAVDPLSNAKDDTQVPNDDTVVPKDDTQVSPFPSVPSVPSVKSSSAKIEKQGLDPEALREPHRTIARSLVEHDASVTLDEVRAVHKMIIERASNPPTLPYYYKIANTGGFVEHLTAVRHRVRAENNKDTAKIIESARQNGPWCKHGDADLIVDGAPLCLLCRTGAPADNSNMPTPNYSAVPAEARAIALRALGHITKGRMEMGQRPSARSLLPYARPARIVGLVLAAAAKEKANERQ